MNPIIKLSFIAALLAFTATSYGSTPFSITFNTGYGNKPTLNFSSTKAITKQEAESAFNSIKNESGIEWGHAYSNCEKRAHAASLILLNKNIGHQKIWNFDPYNISLFYSQEQPSAPDKTGIQKRVSWSYHVAVVVLVKNGLAVDTMVIDPAMSDQVITHTEWMRLQQSPSSFYTFTDPEWYTFTTINGKTYKADNTSIKLQESFPPLLTGDFSKNEPGTTSLSDRWVEGGLAENKVAIKILEEIISKEVSGSVKRLYFERIVSNINTLQSFIKDAETSTQYRTEAVAYKKKFEEYRNEWIAKLDTLRLKKYPSHNAAPVPMLEATEMPFNTTKYVQRQGADGKYEQNH
ncbi:MAG TPA: protein-glutamine glutaminase family protein [Chitinophagales bacterium]|nr:protein-glutamine glutaminase family protein [Chitinophagales bacterium]